MTMYYKKLREKYLEQHAQGYLVVVVAATLHGLYRYRLFPGKDTKSVVSAVEYNNALAEKKLILVDKQTGLVVPEEKFEKLHFKQRQKYKTPTSAEPEKPNHLVLRNYLVVGEGPQPPSVYMKGLSLADQFPDQSVYIKLNNRLLFDMQTAQRLSIVDVARRLIAGDFKAKVLADADEEKNVEEVLLADAIGDLLGQMDPNTDRLKSLKELFHKIANEFDSAA